MIRASRSEGHPGNFGDSIRSELELGSLRRDQGLVLLGQRILGLGHDPDEVLLGERLKLDPDGEAALQLGNEVRRLGDVKRAGGDKQDMIAPHIAVAGLHGGALDVNAADLLGVTDRAVIAAGKLADLIAVRGNPLEDVKTVQQVLWVMKGGVVVKGL